MEGKEEGKRGEEAEKEEKRRKRGGGWRVGDKGRKEGDI